MLVTKRRVKILEDNVAPATQSSHTVTGYTPQPTPGFSNNISNSEGVVNPGPQRTMQQATAGRKEVPNSASSTPQTEESPAPSQNFTQLSELQRGGPPPGMHVFKTTQSADRDLYSVSPDYRARHRPELNDINHRSIVPSMPSQPNPPMPSSSFISAPETHVRSTPPVATTNQFTTVNRPIVTSGRLNNANIVQIEDPNDQDFAPDSQRPPSPQPITRGPRRGEKVKNRVGPDRESLVPLHAKRLVLVGTRSI